MQLPQIAPEILLSLLFPENEYFNVALLVEARHKHAFFPEK